MSNVSTQCFPSQLPKIFRTSSQFWLPFDLHVCEYHMIGYRLDSHVAKWLLTFFIGEPLVHIANIYM